MPVLFWRLPGAYVDRSGRSTGYLYSEYWPKPPSKAEIMTNTRCSDGDLDAVQPSAQQGHERLQLIPTPQQDYERLQLIDTDRLIVKCVQQAGAGSREYVELSTTLLEVGVGTLTNLGKNNLLFPTLRRRRIPVPSPPQTWPNDAARVIYLSVRGTVPNFMRKQVLDGGWDPARGTTLKTFFVTATLYGFAREYRIYYREEIGCHRWEHCFDDVVLLVDSDPSHGPGPPEDPESVAVDRDILRHLLPPDTDPDLLIILVRSSQHFTQKEIAEELGISEEAVSNRLRRFRCRGHP